jgi:hypothetical protein
MFDEPTMHIWRSGGLTRLRKVREGEGRQGEEAINFA